MIWWSSLTFYSSLSCALPNWSRTNLDTQIATNKHACLKIRDTFHLNYLHIMDSYHCVQIQTQNKQISQQDVQISFMNSKKKKKLLISETIQRLKGSETRWHHNEELVSQQKPPSMHANRMPPSHEQSYWWLPFHHHRSQFPMTYQYPILLERHLKGFYGNYILIPSKEIENKIDEMCKSYGTQVSKVF